MVLTTGRSYIRANESLAARPQARHALVAPPTTNGRAPCIRARLRALWCVVSWFVRCVLDQVLRTNTWAQQEDNTWAQSRSYLRYLAWEHWPESASEAKLNQGLVFN